METARRAGLACLHVHLWPSIRDEGADFGPWPIFERVLDEAAALSYPVGVHDEVMFRGRELGGAQDVANSIRRLAGLVKRYGRHAGWYKVDGMPLVYFQNWNRWLSAPDMQRLFREVDEQAGPAYWMVEMEPEEEYLRIPQLRALLGTGNSWFLHTPPFGEGPHPWERLRDAEASTAELVRKHGKRFGTVVFSRFDNHNDRGEPGRWRIDAEDGMFFVKSLESSLRAKPDFVVVSQWNDFEEGGFLEPAWDFDGFRGDPYRYCRIAAAATGRAFAPAPLPAREQVDPFIRHKLYGDSRAGDLGPAFQGASLAGGRLTWRWAAGSDDPKELRLVQGELCRWRAADPLGGRIRLANPSALNGEDALPPGKELRFFVPPLASGPTATLWLAVRLGATSAPSARVDYRSPSEIYRVDFRWERRGASTGRAASFALADGSRVSWQPLHLARFSGYEGDLTLRSETEKDGLKILDLIVWSPTMRGSSTTVTWAMESLALPEGWKPADPFVAVAYDRLGNAGLPRLFYEGRTLPQSTRDPMDLLAPGREAVRTVP